MTVSATTVTQYYTGIFRQAPTAAVQAGYQAMANDAAALNSMLSAANLQVDPVVRLYQTAFNRLPDNAGFTAWVVPFSTGAITLQSIANGFTQSTEFTTLYPTSMSNAQYVGALYWNILQRQGEDAGIKGWVNALNSGALTRAQVLLGFSESAEFMLKVEPGVDAFLSNIAKTPVADQGASALYTGNLFDIGGGTPGNTYVLTTGADNIMGTPNNDTVIGFINTTALSTNSTFQVIDTVDGAGGVNTMKLTVEGTGGATLPAANVTNMQVWTIRDLQSAASSYDFSLYNGVTTAILDRSQNVAVAGVTFSKLGAGATVGMTGAQGAAGAVATTLKFNYATATTPVSLLLNGAVKATGGVAPVITATAGTATAATITTASGAAASSVGAITLTGGTNTITTFNVVANSGLTATLVANDFAATAALVVTGTAKVDLGSNFDGATIDASGNSGGLTITTNAAAGAIVSSIKGSSGKDFVTLGAALKANGTVDLGAGDDTLLGAANNLIASTNTVDGGAGTNYLAAALVGAGNAAVFKNFQGLDVSGYNAAFDTALMTGTTISNIQFSGSAVGTANTATILNVASAATINVVGFLDQAAYNTATLGSLTMTQGASPTLSVVFNAAPTAAAAAKNFATIGTLTETGNTAISINSTGNQYVDGNGIVSIIDKTNVLTTVTITGDKAFTLGDVDTGSTVAVTASSKLVSSLTTIDGSAATGKLTITAGANYTSTTGNAVSYDGLTINGGSNIDTITMEAKNGIVNAGANNDVINVNVPVATVTSNIVTVNGGVGNDTLNSTLYYSAIATASSASTSGNMVVFDATAGDVISFAAVSNATGAFGTKVNVSAAQTLDQAVFIATGSGSVGVTTGTAYWFQYAGNTYIVDRITVATETVDSTYTGAAAAGAVGNSTANDILVKIAGVVDLSTAAVVTGAAGTITLA